MRAIDPLPSGFAATREALHHVAAERVSPARQAVTGRIDLRATPGGFGTPVFGDGQVVRVEGAELVTERAGAPEEREALRGVDDAGALWLGEFYALALDVLETLSEELPPGHDPSPPKLWPEHFDYAIEAGRVRANLGFSPGDADHDEPYVYVGPWEARPAGPQWNATAFPGAELGLDALLATPDPRAAALAFLRDRLAELHAEASQSLPGGGADGEE